MSVPTCVHADPVPLRNTSPFEATTMNVSSVEPNATTFDPPDTGTVPAELQISVGAACAGATVRVNMPVAATAPAASALMSRREGEMVMGILKGG